MKTAKLTDEKEVLDRQQHADLEAQKNLEENLEQLRSRESELDSQNKQMLTRLKNIKDNSAKHREEVKSLNNELLVMKDKHQNARLFNLLVCLLFFIYIFLNLCFFKSHSYVLLRFWHVLRGASHSPLFI